MSCVGAPGEQPASCPRCGMEVDVLFLYCPYCGQSLEAALRFDVLANRAFSRRVSASADHVRERLDELEARLSLIEHDIDVLVR